MPGRAAALQVVPSGCLQDSPELLSAIDFLLFISLFFLSPPFLLAEHQPPSQIETSVEGRAASITPSNPPPPVPSLPPWGPSAIRPGWPRGQEPTVGAGSSELLLHGTIGLEQTKRPEQSASTARSFALLLIFFPLSFPPPLFFCWCRQNPRGRKRGRKEERPGGKQKRGLNKAWGGRGGALGWTPPRAMGERMGSSRAVPSGPPLTSWLP